MFLFIYKDEGIARSGSIAASDLLLQGINHLLLGIKYTIYVVRSNSSRNRREDGKQGHFFIYNYYLFPIMKQGLRGKKFSTMKTVEGN